MIVSEPSKEESNIRHAHIQLALIDRLEQLASNKLLKNCESTQALAGVTKLSFGVGPVDLAGHVNYRLY